MSDEINEKCPVCGKTELDIINQPSGEYFFVCKNCGCNFWSPKLKSIQSLNIRVANIKRQKEMLEEEVKRQKLLIEQEFENKFRSKEEEKYMKREPTRAIPLVVIEKLRALHEVTNISEYELQEMYEEAFYNLPDIIKPQQALHHKCAIAAVWQALSENPTNNVKSDKEYQSLREKLARVVLDFQKGKCNFAEMLQVLLKEDEKAEKEGYLLSLEDKIDRERYMYVLSRLKEKFKKGEISKEVFEILTEDYEEKLADLDYEEE